MREISIFDEPVEVMRVSYVCPAGQHLFTVPFAGDIDEIPAQWRCRKHGVDGPQFGGGTVADAGPSNGRGRSHYEYVRERRSLPELEALLAERLAELRPGVAAGEAPALVGSRRPTGT